MATNNFLPFCATDTGTNLTTQADYILSADRTSGNKPGVASSKLANKALRQSSALVSQLAQYVSNTRGVDVLDDADAVKLLAQITSTFTILPPVFRNYLTGSGSYNATFIFFITAGNATAAATYTNNGNTYTVVSTIAAGTILKCTGSATPTVSGTLTKSGGTGDSTLTFHAMRAPTYIRVRMVGGGGGGSGSSTGSSTGTGAGAGGNTTFGTTLLVANGGAAGVSAGAAGLGGTGSLGSGPVGTAVDGSNGTAGGYIATTGTNYSAAGCGGPSFFGGAGGGGGNGIAGTAAKTNSGSGGGGAGGPGGGTSLAGSGGGSGGFVDALITSPLYTYAYAVGAAGTAGTTVTGFVGGAGAAGLIEVTEFYQ